MLDELMRLLDTPRRTAWGALGLPESGSDILQQHLGMDADSPWTKALGSGLEVLGDPMFLVAGAGTLVGAGSFLGKQAAAARLAKMAALEQQAGRMASAAQGFAKGAQGWEKAGTGIDQLLRARPWLDETAQVADKVPFLAKDFRYSSDMLTKAANERARLFGLPQPRKPALHAAREEMFNAASQARDRGLRWQDYLTQPPAPMGDYAGMLRQAGAQTQNQLPGVLEQLVATRGAPPGLFEEAFLNPERMSALEKALIAGGLGAGVGVGTYAGLQGR